MKVGAFSDEAQGVCFTRKDMSYGPPASLEAWKQQYFVIGGAVAKAFVLQLYDSKRAYEEVKIGSANYTAPRARGGEPNPRGCFLVEERRSSFEVAHCAADCCRGPFFASAHGPRWW